jgi:hypothetical protein
VVCRGNSFATAGVQIRSGFGTRRPDAIVAALSKNSELSRCCSNALTMGAQPEACAEIIRGRSRPISPMVSSSSNAFHIPIRPTPPPVG